MTDDFVESVQFRADGLQAVQAAIADLDRGLDAAAVQAAATAKAVADPAYRKAVADLDRWNRANREAADKLIAVARAQERQRAAAGGDYLRQYREELALKERLARIDRAEAAQRLTADRAAFHRGDPVGRARADQAVRFGQQQLAADQERARLAARLQVSQADELRMAKDAAALDRMRQQVAEKIEAARLATLPTAERRRLVTGVAIADTAAGAAGKRVSAAAEEARMAGVRAGYERQAALERARGSGGLADARERLRAERQTAELARQERANDRTARYGRAGGRLAGALESRAAGAAGAAAAGAGLYGMSLVRRGYDGTVEQAVMDLQEQRLRRNLAGGFRPYTNAYTRALDIGNRYMEQGTAEEQDQRTKLLAAGGVVGSGIIANTASSLFTGRSLITRAGGAGRLGVWGAVAAGAVNTVLEGERRGGGVGGYAAAVAENVRTFGGNMFGADPGRWAMRQFGGESAVKMHDDFLTRLGLRPAAADTEAGAAGRKKSTLAINDGGYTGLGDGRDRAQVAALMKTLPNDSGDMPAGMKQFLDRLERMLLGDKQSPSSTPQRIEPDPR